MAKTIQGNILDQRIPISYMRILLPQNACVKEFEDALVANVKWPCKTRKLEVRVEIGLLHTAC
jgi:hypothetical protein